MVDELSNPTIEAHGKTISIDLGFYYNVSTNVCYGFAEALIF